MFATTHPSGRWPPSRCGARSRRRPRRMRERATTSNTRLVEAGSSGGGGAQKVAVLLPDTSRRSAGRPRTGRCCRRRSTPRACPSEIQNAQGDKSTQQQQAEQAITNGAKILLLDEPRLRLGRGDRDATPSRRGVKVIDYDRLTLKGKADYYVSFDNVKVGKLQGQGLVECLSAARRQAAHRRAQRLADDNNATLFAQGYNSVLDPMYKAGKASRRSPTSPCPTGTTSRR